jgi:hypothetical protein
MQNCAEFQVSKLNRIRKETVGDVIRSSDAAVLKPERELVIRLFLKQKVVQTCLSKTLYLVKLLHK